MTKDSDRILCLEINFQNFMENVNEKFDAIMSKLNEMPKTYATKSELESVKQQIIVKWNTKVVWIQTRWALLVAIVSAVWLLLSKLF